MQTLADEKTHLIYDVDEAMGSIHAVKKARRLCKETLLILPCLIVLILTDSGYQGIREFHEWSLIPAKKGKGRELSEVEKTYIELQQKNVIEFDPFCP